MRRFLGHLMLHYVVAIVVIIPIGFATLLGVESLTGSVALGLAATVIVLVVLYYAEIRLLSRERRRP